MRSKVGVVQFDPKLGLSEHNMLSLERLVARAADAGAALVVAPEMATTGYLFVSRDEAAPHAEPVPGPATSRLSALCARLGVFLVVGLLERDDRTGFLYNTAALLGPQGYIGKYRKTHPFLADTRWAVDGDLGFPVFDLPFGRVGIMVCMDVSYFETARLSAVQGAQILAFPLNSRQPSPTEQWSVRAAENGFYILAANRTGFERGTRFGGGSSVVAPDGTVLSTAQGDEGIAVAEVDTDLCGRDVFGFGRPVGERCVGAYYPLVLSPYRWSAPEVYSMNSEGSPGVLVVPGALSGRFAEVRSACEKGWYEFSRLHRSKPDIVVLPERALKAPGGLDAGHAAEWGSEVAEALGSTVVFGFGEHSLDGMWNSMMLVTPRGERHMYRQVHVAPHDMPRVRRGGAFKVVDLPWGRVGLALGADLFYPETARCLAQMGADIVLAGIERDPTPLGLMLKERAKSNNTHIAVASASGPSRIYLAEDQAGPETTASEAGQCASRFIHLTKPSSVRTKPMLQKRRPELYSPLCM